MNRIRLQRLGLVIMLVAAVGLHTAGAHGVDLRSVSLTDRHRSAIASPNAAQQSSVPFLNRAGEIREAGRSADLEAKAAIDGDLLAIPLGAAGVALYDIAVPERPQVLAHISTSAIGGRAGAVALSGDRLYVATAHIMDDDGIVFFDIAKPTQPHRSGSFGNFHDIVAMQVRGHNLFVYVSSIFDTPGGVYVYDLRPATPAFLGSYVDRRIDQGFFVSDAGIVFLARSIFRLGDFPHMDVVDMSNPADPRLLAQWVLPYSSSITDIHVVAGKAYIAAYRGGVWVLDVTDPRNIQVIDAFNWADQSSYAWSVRALPPFVFASKGHDQRSMRQFNTLHLDGSNLDLVQAIPSAGAPSYVYLHDQLLVLEEWQGDDKVFRLYHVGMQGYLNYVPYMLNRAH